MNRVCVRKTERTEKLNSGSIQQLQISGTTPSSSTSINTAGTDASVGPASVMVGNLVQGNRLASAQGRDIGLADDNERKVSRFYWFFDIYNSNTVTGKRYRISKIGHVSMNQLCRVFHMS